MFYRKITSKIEGFLSSDSTRILLVDGARQIGKTFIIRHLGRKMFPHFVEINMEADKVGDRIFAEAKTTKDFYMALSSVAGNKLKGKKDTLVFIDEIQAYDHLLTLLKFLRDDDRYTYIASGSQLGVALKRTSSIPLGSIHIERMYPMDFEEFLMANGVGAMAIDAMRESFARRESLSDAMHNKVMSLFRHYLIVGGMPAAVDAFVSTQNITKVRNIQSDIRELYGIDASRYEADNGKRLKIRRIYDMIPSSLENKKKRIVARDIEDKDWKRMDSYQDEFDYLIASGITLEVSAISNPKYPLVESVGKNLLKLYINDVGILSGIFYKNNTQPLLQDIKSINLGSIYETVVAQELKAHGHKLFYYDNKKNGEVDFLIDDADTLSVLPVEVKSGKDYSIHSALNKFLSIEEYNIHHGIVLSSERTVRTTDGKLYLPIYDVMFI